VATLFCQEFLSRKSRFISAQTRTFVSLKNYEFFFKVTNGLQLFLVTSPDYWIWIIVRVKFCCQITNVETRLKVGEARDVICEMIEQLKPDVLVHQIVDITVVSS
jgi:hypothetical protein